MEHFMRLLTVILVSNYWEAAQPHTKVCLRLNMSTKFLPGFNKDFSSIC